MKFGPSDWAIILGGSSGFGLASAKKLAAHGMNIALVHRDRRGAMKRVEPEFEWIRNRGAQLLTFNADALAAGQRSRIAEEIGATLGTSGRVRLLLHSIAFGNLKPLDPQAALSAEDEDIAATIYNMGTSIYSWTREILTRNLFADDARVIGLTSEGNEIAWRGYAAVSAAKVAMEALSRSMALELAPYGLRSNIIQAGIAETPASDLISGIEQMKADARARNPFGRLTVPDDIANVVYLLTLEESSWINGSIVRADGGEHISGGAC